MKRRRRAITGNPGLRRFGGALLLTGLLAIPVSPVHSQDPALRIEQVVRLALERNERSRAAEARVNAAEARVGNARSYFLPDLTLVGNYTRRAYQNITTSGGQTSVLQRHHALSPTATLNLTIFDARSFPAYGQFQRERDAARLSSVNEKRLLSFDAADAFLTALSATQVREAAERRLELARKNLSDARARFEAQIVSVNDVTRAELELATAERELTRARGEAEISRLRLGYLIDQEVPGRLETPSRLLDAAARPPALAEELVTAAQGKRPDLAASREHARGVRLLAREPLLRLLPSLTFTGKGSATNETGIYDRRYDGSAALALTWRLFDGGRLYADRTERLALSRIADLDVQAATRRVSVEVRSALVSLSNGQAAIRQATVAVEVAKKNAQQTAELYRQGLANELQAADANVRLFEAEVELARARYILALAYMDMRAAIGLDPLGEEPTP